MYAFTLAGLVFAVAATPLMDYDIWWHLATGRVIADLHIIPKNDLFSYTAFGAPWVNHEWLFQLFAWLVFEQIGVAFATLFKLVCTTAIAFVIFRTIVFLTKSKSAALWGTALLIYTISVRIMERPFLIGLLILAIFCYILHRYILSDSHTIWLLPLLQILWINLHGGGLLGPEIVFAYALGETLCGLTWPQLGGPTPISAERRRKLWIVSLACLAACTINPWGIETLLFPFQHLGMKTILSQTQEWVPLLHPRLDGMIPIAIVPVVAAATLASLVFCARQIRLSLLLLVILMSYLLLKSHRFFPDFIIVTLPILFTNISNIVQKRTTPRWIENTTPLWINLLIVLAISYMAAILGVPATTSGEKLHEPSLGATIYSTPPKMIDFLEQHHIQGRVFNEMSLGGYLIFRRWPHELVFIDGRTPIFGDTFFEQVVNVFRNARNFEELDKQYHFDYIVFSGVQLRDRLPFHRYLWTNANWRLVYAASDGMVYLRNEFKFAPLIEKLTLKTNPLLDDIEKR